MRISMPTLLMDDTLRSSSSAPSLVAHFRLQPTELFSSLHRGHRHHLAVAGLTAMPHRGLVIMRLWRADSTDHVGHGARLPKGC